MNNNEQRTHPRTLVWGTTQANLSFSPLRDPKHSFHTTWKLVQAGQARTEQQTWEYTCSHRGMAEKNLQFSKQDLFATKEGGKQHDSRHRGRKDASQLPKANRAETHDARHSCDTHTYQPSTARIIHRGRRKKINTNLIKLNT